MRKLFVTLSLLGSLLFPLMARAYEVQPGDTVGRLAKTSGVSIDTFLSWNPAITNRDRIYVGQKLAIKANEVLVGASYFQSGNVFNSGPGAVVAGTIENTPESFTVTDTSTAWLDTNGAQKVAAALQPSSMTAFFTGYATPYLNRGESSFFSTNQGTPWLLGARYYFSGSTTTIVHDATPDGVQLRAVIMDNLGPATGKAALKLVADLGGLGPSSFTDNNGYIWPVEDYDAPTIPGFPICINEADNLFVVSSTLGEVFSGDKSRVELVNPVTVQMFESDVTPCLGQKPVFFDRTASTTARLEANFTNTSNHIIESETGMDYAGVYSLPFILDIYYNHTLNRLEHGLSFLPQVFPLMDALDNRFVDVSYNANASSDGFPLRFYEISEFNAGLYYDNTSTATTTNGTIYTSTTARPSQETVESL